MGRVLYICLIAACEKNVPPLSDGLKVLIVPTVLELFGLASQVHPLALLVSNCTIT